MVAVSIVSHGHGAMVSKLVSQLIDCDEVSRIIVTLNIKELISFPKSDRLVVVNNIKPKGFGANHNQAFGLVEESYFCILNPDINLLGNPFRQLLKIMESGSSQLSAPCILSPAGLIEDSVRYFPTFRGLAAKGLKKSLGKFSFSQRSESFFPDWVAGMFMLFRSDAYAELSGFDEGFFLYYEDVDICVRAWRAGMKIVVCPSVCVIHDARRDSHRHIRYLCLHLWSMARYFFKHFGRLPTVHRGAH